MTIIEAMRKYIWILSLLAGTGWLSSCVNDPGTESVPASSHTILFVATTPGAPDSRTAFEAGEAGIYPTRWTSRDSAVAVSFNGAAPSDAPVKPASDGRSAHIEYSFGSASEYSFHLLTPATAAEGMSASRKSWQIRIPALQTPTADSPDEAAQILAATTGTLSQAPAKLDVRFSHVTAYGKVTLRNLPADAHLRSVTLSCSVPLAGSWYLSPETGALEALEASSTLELYTSATENIWFACAPGDVSGATLRVIADTDQGTFEKEIRFQENRSFKPGKVAAFSVDFSGITPSVSSGNYMLVTDASTLAAGDEILLLDKDGTYAVSTNQKKNNRGAAAVTVRDGQVIDPGTDVERFTLKGKTGAWNIQISASGQYLHTKEDSKNTLLTQSGTSDNLASWTISIASDGTATIAAPYSSGSTKRTMMFNYGDRNNLLFATYTSTTGNRMSLMAIYRKTAVNGSVYADDPVLERQEYGAYRSSGDRVYVSGSDQLSREYAADGSTLTFAILDPAKASVLELGGIPTAPLVGDRFSLSCREMQGVQLTESGYTVTVLRVDASKVWLSDGRGNGFIVKK